MQGEGLNVVYHSVTISRFASTAVFTLNRFVNAVGAKDTTAVTFPLLGLDLGSIMGSGQPVNTFVYDLVGVIEHQGESVNSGVFHWRQCDCIVTSSFCVQDTTLQKSDIYHPVGLVVGTR